MTVAARARHMGAVAVGWTGLILLGLAMLLFMIADQFEAP